MGVENTVPSTKRDKGRDVRPKTPAPTMRIEQGGRWEVVDRIDILCK